jgi:hypothetical protein
MSIIESEVIGSPGSVTGDFESTANAYSIKKKKKTGAGTAILQGENTAYENASKSFIKCPVATAGQLQPGGVCIKDTTDNSVDVEVFDQNGQITDSKAGGALTAGCPLKPSVGVAGAWDRYIQGTDSPDLYRADYLGHPILGEGDGKTFATDAIAGDVIKIKLK